SELGIGFFVGEPVYLLVLDRSVTVEGCSFQGLRQFMVEGDFAVFQMLGNAAQVSTWAREHRFCGACGRATVQIRGER
ncbi:NADH pyrophosphatase zinc ribbon domain-containing protein, partial [Pseudomonas syringae pv. tagetis]|uniref:NADH pyrophosphatase zinc ribbon domain-containing protein n=1 Tax=Pseudomonas syringae group genomosp. 7 TaxID=251699 RepID=UPI0037701D5A